MSAEINRRIDNLIRFGLIAEVDHVNAKARVKCGQILTSFLPFITIRAGTTKTWSPPTVGEQCVILASSGELTTACILVGLYTQNSPSHSPDVHVIEFADGAKIEYNQSSGALVVTGIKTAAITAANQINIDCPTVNIKGNVNIMGAITTADNGGAKGNISISGNVEVKGTVTAKGDVKAGTISLQNHTHQEQGDGNLTSKAK
nr:phage baseplate assembly protein V [uncultured Aggregatibacter sp.]